jgi:2-methylcitrate dehydratase PrpD
MRDDQVLKEHLASQDKFFDLSRRRLLQGALAAGSMAGVSAMFPAAALAQQEAQKNKSATATVCALAMARVLNNMNFANLPPTAVKHAKMIIASTLASAASGTSIRSAVIVRDLAKEQGGKPEATIWYDGAKLPVALAARVNSMLSDSAACDDSDLRNVAHTGTCLTSVGLAFGERMGATGQDVLCAMVSGYEAAGRVGETIIANSTDSDRIIGAVSGRVGRGFHASSIVAFGGCVTAGRLLRLSDEQLAHALCATATTVGGVSISTNSWAREYHAGNAALTGVNAALAAGRGFTVNRDMLEAKGGFLDVFTGNNTDTSSLIREIGNDSDYQISRFLALKLVPGAHALHPAVEAAVDAARESNVAPDDVAAILVAGPQSRLVAGNQAPKDMIEAIHSLSYYIASAVADKNFTWVHAEPKMILRPVIAQLIGLVQQDPAPPKVQYKWGWGATVTIVTKSGKRFVSTVDAPRGSAPRGIEWSDLYAKYNALMPVSGLSAQRIAAILQAVQDFERAERTSQLTVLLS